MKENFLHIGYHKTATTWMQQFMFPIIFESKYFGKSIEQKRDDTLYLREMDNLKNLFYKNSNACFSDEFFMKPMPRGKFDFEKNIAITDRNNMPTPSKEFYICSDNHVKSICNKICSNLVDENINTKVILSIRNQTDMFFSMYLHQERAPHQKWNSPDIWVKDLNGFISKFDRKFLTKKLKNYYDFNNTYTQLVKTFGQKNVHVIIYENLFKNTENEINRLYCFMAKEMDLKALEQIKSRVSTKKNDSRNDSYKRQKNGEDIRKLLMQEYKDSNKELSKLIKFDLSKYGYHQ